MGVEALDPAQELEAKALRRHKAMNEATARGDSAVQQFYSGAVVFVTGGSGFLGKQLIEKLFRATKIAKLFVLLRPKKGKSVEQRLKDLLQDPVYDLVKDQHPDFADKIVPIAGDIADLRLGINHADWKTITEQVDIIFHMAATTRFDESLRVATMINVRGTREAITLGKECKKLRSYIHVSTAYSHACENLINTEVLEDFYPSPLQPEALIGLAETLDSEKLEDVTPRLIKNWPNTYSFAKAVAEEIVRTQSEDLPICVVRPAIVICANREPSPGWVDKSNVFGASGVLLGPALGVMHTMIANDQIKIGVVPVDQVNNAIIAAAWDTAKRRAAGETETKIYAVTTSTRNPTLWRGLVNIGENVARKEYPTPAAIGLNFVWHTNNPVLFWIFTWLLHMIPAYITDGICWIFGQERRFVKLSTKLYKMCIALSYFTCNDWEFVDNNTEALFNKLSTADQEIFDFDVKNVNWNEYMLLWCVGLRKYVIKDGLKGTAYAKKKQFIFKILTYVIAPLYFYFIFRIVCLAFSLVLSLF